MKYNQPFCILFSGVIGVSKTPIAYYLSYKLNLPVFNNDAIRTEVIEDLTYFSQEAYEKRQNARLFDLIESKRNFIYDASIDRSWNSLLDRFKKSSYQTYVISLDLSKRFIERLYKNKE